MAKKVFVSAMVLVASCITAWGQVENYGTGNNTVNISANNSTLTINVTGDATKITGIGKIIETAILADNYSTIYSTITVTGGQINSEIVHSILYQNISTDPNNASYKKNEALTTIDLGTTTVTDFNTNTFKYDNAWQGNCNLETITLPKTNMVDGKMTVPTQVLSFTENNYNSKVKTVIIPEGYTNVGERAFYGFNSSVTMDFNIILPNTLREIDTEAFLEVKKLKDITLPEGLVTIGKRAFKDCISLTNPKFPSTLKEILSEAYSGIDNIKNIKFNEGIEFIGNSAFLCTSAVENCQKTIIFPSSLKYMGPGAFYGRRFEDVYFNSMTAPLCPIGKIFGNTAFYESAFEDAVHMGNNGFNANKGEISDDTSCGFANRENYKNNGVYFTMLHFPNVEEIGEDNAETYTDITREYKTTKESPLDNLFPTKETLFLVGKENINYSYKNYSLYNEGQVKPGFIDTYRGMQYIWPSQSQWQRSFVCNSLGYKWDGVTTYRPDITDDQIALMIKDGLTIENGGTITESNKDKYSDELSMTAYMGTRQFVLANSDHEASNEYKVKDIQGGYWWTLCVPFNMTKKQIDEVFGEGTHVCLFSDVERHAEGSQKKITLKFVHDVYAHKTVKDANGNYATNFNDNASACGDDDIVIYAHESYMIYPTKTEADAVFVVNNYEPIEGSPLPTIVTASDGTEYRFIGNYTTQIGGDEIRKAIERIKTITIPQYSYMYAKKKTEPNYKFWFYSGTTMAWKANKCVVQATAKDGGTTDFNNFFGDTTSQAKQASIFGSDDIDDKPTEIEHVEIIAGEQPKNNIKYDLYGRHVADDYKGIYIMNGKKYINR